MNQKLPPETLVKIIKKANSYKTPEDRSRNFYFMCIEAKDDLIKRKERQNKKQILQRMRVVDQIIDAQKNIETPITTATPFEKYNTFKSTMAPIYKIAASIIGPILGFLALNQAREVPTTLHQNQNKKTYAIEASILPSLSIQKYLFSANNNTIKQPNPQNLETNINYTDLKIDNTRKKRKAFEKPVMANHEVPDSSTAIIPEHISEGNAHIKTGKIKKTWYRLITETYNPENFAAAKLIGNAVVQYNLIHNPSKIVKESLGRDPNNDGLKGDLTYSSEQYLLPELEYLIANNYLAATDLEISRESKNKAKIAQEKSKENPKSDTDLESRIGTADTLTISQNYVSNRPQIVFDKNTALEIQEMYNSEYRKQAPKATMTKYSVSKKDLVSLIAESRQHEGTSFNNSKIVFESLSGNEIKEIVIKYLESPIKEAKAYALEAHHINIRSIYSFLNNVQKALGVDEIRKSKMIDAQRASLIQTMQTHYA